MTIAPTPPMAKSRAMTTRIQPKTPSGPVPPRLAVPAPGLPGAGVVGVGDALGADMGRPYRGPRPWGGIVGRGVCPSDGDPAPARRGGLTRYTPAHAQPPRPGRAPRDPPQVQPRRHRHAQA